MLNSSVLETAIGLVFVYLIFSLIASAIAEYISALMDRRGQHLKHILLNLFDSDDPQGRAFLNLFVSHPMVQALNSTDWKPTFRSVEERLGEGKAKLEQTKETWNLASIAVSKAGEAKLAATKADAAGARAVETAAILEKARKALNAQKPETAGAVQAEITATEAAAETAERAASAADQAATAARTAADSIARAKAKAPQTSSAPDHANPAAAPESTGAKAVEVSPVPVTAPAGDDVATKARAVADRASKAAASAKKAASEARSAASLAEKAKNGLYADIIGLFNVPKYIPDRTFADVVVNVLTSEGTLETLLKDDENSAGVEGEGGLAGSGEGETQFESLVSPFWDRFGAALGIVRGIASRLPASDVKSNIDRCINAIDESLKLAGQGTRAALSVLSALQKGTDELRGAVAAVPDDALRAALEREIETSVSPLHVMGKDVLLLQRASQAIALMADSSVKTALVAFLTQAGDDLDLFKRSISAWYNDVMDHASGWYKRNTQAILALIAVVLCSVNNVDTVRLVRALSLSRELRASVAKMAEESTKNGMVALEAKGGDVMKESLEATKLPLWWSRDEFQTWWGVEPTVSKDWMTHLLFYPRKVLGLLISTKVLGLLISAMAVSMGAPFWFDLLNKLVNVRLVGKRPDPSVDDPPLSVDSTIGRIV